MVAGVPRYYLVIRKVIHKVGEGPMLAVVKFDKFDSAGNANFKNFLMSQISCSWSPVRVSRDFG